MASASTLPLATSLPPIKYVPFDPSSLKRKTKSKPKPKNKPNITEHGLYEDGSHGYDGEWADIDDFSTDLSDSNALRSLNPGLPAAVGATGPSCLLHPDSEGDLGTVPLPQIPQSQQSGQEGPDRTAGVEMNLAVSGLFDGSSPEFPLVLDDDAAGANHILEDIQSSGGQREYQDDDLDAADMRAFSVENTGGVYNDNFPEQKDVSVTSLPSATRKRNYTLFADTITSKPASKDSRLVKRWRSAQPQVESLVPSPVCTPTSTPSADCGSQILSLRTSNDLDAGYLDNSSKGNGADVLDPVRGGLLDSVNSGDGEHDRHAIDEVLSESERMKGYQYVNPDLYGGEDKSHGTGSKVRDSDEDELNWANDVSSRAATATFQQHKCSSRPLHDSRRGPSRTSLKHLGGNMRPARIKSSPLRRYSGPKSDVATRSDTLQTSSSGTRAVHNHTINYGQGDPVDCCPTDITLSLVPKCTTLVTAIIRSNEMTSKLAPKPLTVVRDLLGDTGQLIRMTQVTSDLWLLVSCRFDHTLDLHTGRSSTQRSGDYAAWKTDPCSPHSKGANYDAVGPDEGEEDIDDGDDHLENGDESSGGSDSDAAAGWRPNRNRRRIQVRTRRPWPKSDDLRLLACKSKMGMKWEDIFPLFPSRTPGAVQARWYMLQRPEES